MWLTRTSEGIEKTEGLHPAELIERMSGRKLDLAIIALLMLALGWFAWDKFGPGSTPLVAEAKAPTWRNIELERIDRAGSG